MIGISINHWFQSQQDYWMGYILRVEHIQSKNGEKKSNNINKNKIVRYEMKNMCVKWYRHPHDK